MPANKAHFFDPRTASTTHRANSGMVQAVVRLKWPLRWAAMYGDVPKMTPARMAAPRWWTIRHARRYAEKPFSARDPSVVRFRAVTVDRRPNSVAPTKAGRAVCVGRVRSAPTGANRYVV